jgi:hypothetical protein
VTQLYSFQCVDRRILCGSLFRIVTIEGFSLDYHLNGCRNVGGLPGSLRGWGSGLRLEVVVVVSWSFVRI